MTFTRIQHAGAAVTSALVANIAAGDTTLSLTTVTNWPDGAVGPFYLAIDAGVAGEEKLLATTRSGNSLTGLTRGVDGTTPVVHQAGAVVQHIGTAVEFDEANQAVVATLGAVTQKADLLTASGPHALVREAVGADATVYVADASKTTGHDWRQLTAASIANSAIGTNQLAANAVTGTILADASVDTAALIDAAVTGAKIADATVGTTNLIDGLVVTTKLADASVTQAKLTAGQRATWIAADATALAALTPTSGDLALQVDKGYLLEYSGTAWRGVSDLALGNRRRLRFIKQATPGGTEDLTSGSAATYPPQATFSIAVPAWATKAIVRADMNQFYAVTAGLNHQLQLAIGSTTGTGRRIRWAEQISGTAGTVDASSRQDISLTDEIDVTSVQGTTVVHRITGQRVSGTGALRCTADSIVTLDIEFLEANG